MAASNRFLWAFEGGLPLAISHPRHALHVLLDLHSCSRRSPRRATQVSSVAPNPSDKGNASECGFQHHVDASENLANKKWDVNKTLVKIYIKTTGRWMLNFWIWMPFTYLPTVWHEGWLGFVFGALKIVLGTEILLMIQKSRRSPVEIGTSSYYLQGFSTSQVVQDFWTINSSFPRSPVDQTKAPLSFQMDQGIPILLRGKVWSTWTSWVLYVNNWADFIHHLFKF